MQKEIKNRERLRFGILEYCASGIIDFLIISNVPQWITRRISTEIIFLAFVIFFWYGIPLICRGNHVIGTLLRFQVVHGSGKPVSAKDILSRQSLKLLLLISLIDLFRMMIFPNRIPLYDKLLRIKIIEDSKDT